MLLDRTWPSLFGNSRKLRSSVLAEVLAEKAERRHCQQRRAATAPLCSGREEREDRSAEEAAAGVRMVALTLRRSEVEQAHQERMEALALATPSQVSG